MASRVENVVNKILVTGSSNYRVDVSSGNSEVQIVLDRTKFERSVRRKGPIVRIEIRSGRTYLGGVEFGDQRIDGAAAPRPGQRMLWSTGKWPLPKGARNIDIRVRAVRGFNCLLHVDFL